MKAGIVLAAGVCGIVLTVSASAELSLTNSIPASAQWVVHADFGQLRTTSVGKFILGELGEEDPGRKLDAFKAVFRFDPRSDVSGLTLYGSDNRRENVIALFRGAFDAEHLVTLICANTSYQSEKYGEHTIHRWIDDNKKEESFGAILANGVIAIGGGVGAVKEALDVSDGRKAGLQSSDKLAGLIPPVQSAFFVAVANLSGLDQVNPRAAMLKQAQAGQLILGEQAGRVTARLALQAGTQEAAAQIDAVARGLVALAVLAREDNPQLSRLAESLRFSMEGQTVSAALDCPAEDVIKWMESWKPWKEKLGTPVPE